MLGKNGKFSRALALLLSLAMVLSLAPGFAAADDTDARETEPAASAAEPEENGGIRTLAVSVTSAEELAAALGGDDFAEADGDTVTLKADVALTETVCLTDGDITLDLNGYGICNSTEGFEANENNCLFEAYSSDLTLQLTVTDSSQEGTGRIYAESATGSELSCLFLVHGISGCTSILTIRGGELDCDGCYGGGSGTDKCVVYLERNGFAQIQGGVLKGESANSLLYVTRSDKTGSGGEIKITGGTFEAPAYGIYLNAPVTANISGGTFTGGSEALFDLSDGGAVLNISGGEFKDDSAASGLICEEADGASVTVSDGVFASAEGKNGILQQVSGASAVITGGTFTVGAGNDNRFFYCGGSLRIDDGTFRIGSTSGFYPQAGFDLEINGGTFTGSESTDYVLYLRYSGSARINGGTFTGNGGYDILDVNASGLTVDITGGTFTAEDGVCSRGCCNFYNGAVNIYGGTFSGTGSGDCEDSIFRFSSSMELAVHCGDFSADTVYYYNSRSTTGLADYLADGSVEMRMSYTGPDEALVYHVAGEWTETDGDGNETTHESDLNAAVSSFLVAAADSGAQEAEFQLLAAVNRESDDLILYEPPVNVSISAAADTEDLTVNGYTLTQGGDAVTVHAGMTIHTGGDCGCGVKDPEYEDEHWYCPVCEQAYKTGVCVKSEALLMAGQHVWEDPEWTWTATSNGYTVTVTFTCSDCGEQTTVGAEVDSVTTDPTCTAAGSTVYTATAVLDGETYTDTKTDTIPATGHTWTDVTFEWSDDYASATASAVCSVCGTRETVKASVSSKDTKNQRVFTATATFSDGQTRTEEVTVGIADKEQLDDEIWYADLLDESDYTAASWAALQEALAEAVSVNERKDATQDEVNAALRALIAAEAALVRDTGYSAGFVWENSEWRYYDRNGKRVTNGILQDTDRVVDGTDGWFYVANGKVDFSYTGVSNFSNSSGWWYIKAGKVDFSKTGIEQNSYGWWRVVNGKVDFSCNSVEQNDWGWWYLVGGKVQFGYTGVSDYPNAYGWWYISGGKVDFSKNSVEPNSYGWWYVLGGKVDFSYTGVGNYSNANGWWYVKGGKVDFSKTGIEQNKWGWWRVVGGKVDFSCNSVEQNDYGWWYVTGGKVDFGYTGVANYANAYGWWYIKAGKVDFGYTGPASNRYGTWYVVSGKVDFSRS